MVATEQRWEVEDRIASLPEAGHGQRRHPVPCRPCAWELPQRDAPQPSGTVRRSLLQRSLRRSFFHRPSSGLIGSSLLVFTKSAIQGRPTAKCEDALRIEPDGLVEVLEGLLVVTSPRRKDRTICVGGGAVGVDLKCPVPVLQRFLRIPDLPEGSTSIDPGRHIVGVQFQGRAHVGDRLFEHLALEIEITSTPNRRRKRFEFGPDTQLLFLAVTPDVEDT